VEHVLLVGGEEEDGGEEHPPDEGDEPHLRPSFLLEPLLSWSEVATKTDGD
jgi:hypothetical protein